MTVSQERKALKMPSPYPVLRLCRILIMMKKAFSLFLLFNVAISSALAGIGVVRSNGISLTGADGVDFIGVDGMRFTGADGFLSVEANGVRFTGADGVRFTGADGTRFTGADGTTYTSSNGARFTGADGISILSADGMRFTGADGYRFTGADGTTYQANSIIVRQANGIGVTNPSTISLTGPDGVRFTGADGYRFTGADGMRFTGADGVRFTGADAITGFDSNGVVFNFISPTGFSITGVDGTRFTGADVSLTVGNDIAFTGANGARFTGADGSPTQVGGGLLTVDPELALLLNQATDDSTVNAVVVFHQYPTAVDLNDLSQIGIMGGTQFRVLPMIYITATRRQILALSHLGNVRSIYGNRTLQFNIDPFYKTTQVQRITTDRDLQNRNGGLPVTGRNVTVAILDTGVNSLHPDLSGKVVQNVRLLDTQSAAVGFVNPSPVENVANTDLAGGHGTFVAGVVAASGISSSGKYNGIASGANILGLSAGDLNLLHVLSGFDYLLDHRTNYNVRVVNCSFSANTIFDYNDPVNIATKQLTDNGINVVFSAGNSGPGNGTLNPYAAAPWVISVGATDEKGVLADFSSRGAFGDSQFAPSLSAPGVNVISLRSAATQTGTLGVAGSDTQRLTPAELPFYTTASGTSFSAPQVAGAIALMLEVNPSLSPSDIKDILQRSATPLPNYYYHEVGAGMLNTYAAVLEAAFPSRRTGIFRSVMDSDSLRYVTATTQTFDGSVGPNTTSSATLPVSPDTVQSSVYIAWGNLTNPNDLNLKVYDASGNLQGNSSNLNLSGLTGKTERITLSAPNTNVLQAVVGYTLGDGSTQSFLGAVDTTRIQYDQLSDILDLSAQDRGLLNEGMRKFLVKPDGTRFHPDFAVSRSDLAAAIVRSGRIPQFVAASRMYTDVRDLTTRNAVESAQANRTGSLFYDAVTNGAFRPDESVSRLAAAVALVKAAQLDGLAASSSLPVTVIDASDIPIQYRGYVAVALQKGWLTLNQNSFRPASSLSRIELARAIVGLSR